MPLISLVPTLKSEAHLSLSRFLPETRSSYLSKNRTSSISFARNPNSLKRKNQPALEKDRYKIREAFIAAPGNSLIVADYGQLELRILAHLANCKSMLEAFEAGGDFHSRTAMNMYQERNFSLLA
ncbi:DNA polymerase I A, chloroplastic/mitochondrial [Trifolium repens]|nr:DNA polymerase I A, chloroplastic/mitochondrial [Trifolium repens]